MPKVKEKSKPIKIRGKDIKTKPLKTVKATKSKTTDVASYKNNIYGKILDQVEKDVGVSSEEMSTTRLSTGTLALDMIIGGGMRSGMMTQAGEEASAKSTSLLTSLVYAANAGVPIVEISDAEGCLIGTDKVLTVNGYVTFDELFKVAADYWKNGNYYVQVLTPENKPVVASLFDGGEKPVTYMETESGHNITGYNHPVLVVLGDGSGVWKALESLEEGDEVLVK